MAAIPQNRRFSPRHLDLLPITQAEADDLELTEDDDGLLVNIEGWLNKWNGTDFEKQLKEEDVPESDADNFTKVGEVIHYSGEFGRRLGGTVVFGRSAIHANEFEGNTDNWIKPVYTDLVFPETIAGSKEGHTIKIIHSSESVPAALDSGLPDYVIIPAASDAYLTGFENLNLITLTFHRIVEVDSVVHRNVYVCTILAVTDGNTDLTPYLLIDLNFNENESPVEYDSVINSSSMYGDVLVPVVNNPTLGGGYIDLGGGNYAFEVDNVSTVLGSRTNISIPLDSETSALFGPEITVMFRVQFFSHSTDTERPVITNRDGNTGWNLVRKTTGEFGLRVGTIDGSASTETNSTGADIQLDNGYYLLCGRFRWDGANRTGEVYIKSFDNMRDFELVGSSSGTSARTTEHLEDISLDQTIGVSGVRNKAIDAGKVWIKYLTFDQMLAEAILMDGPNNAV